MLDSVKGKLTLTDGAMYEGDWADGEQNGLGKMIYTDGTVNEGRFVNSEFAR